MNSIYHIALDSDQDLTKLYHETADAVRAAGGSLHQSLSQGISKSFLVVLLPREKDIASFFPNHLAVTKKYGDVPKGLDMGNVEFYPAETTNTPGDTVPNPPVPEPTPEQTPEQTPEPEVNTLPNAG
jgi:hypothetical protein